MIPATSFLRDGDTALALLHELAQYVPANKFPEVWLNRPCDTCDGLGHVPNSTDFWDEDCPDCDGTGRHTFTVEVGCSCVCHSGRRTDRIACVLAGKCDPTHRTLTVHVIDVLPIRGGAPSDPPWTAGERLVHVMSDASAFIVTARGDGHGASDVEQRITLPSAAEPGQYLVRLEVHQ